MTLRNQNDTSFTLAMSIFIKTPEQLSPEYVNYYAVPKYVYRFKTYLETVHEYSQLYRLDTKTSRLGLHDADPACHKDTGHPTHASSSAPSPKTTRSTEQAIAAIAAIAKEIKRNPLALPFYNSAIAAAASVAAKNGNIGGQINLPLAAWLQDPQASIALVDEALVRDLDAEGHDLETVEHDLEAVEYFICKFDANVDSLQETDNVHLP